MAEQDYLARFRTGGATPAPAEQAPPGQTDYLARFRNQATAGPQPNIPIEQNTLGEEFRAGLGAGIDTAQGSLFGVAALVGRELGIDWMEKAGLEGAAEQFAQAGQATSTAGGFTDIEGPGDFFRWSSNALGQAIPSLATAIAGGGVGGAVAKRSVEGGVKRALARTIEKELKTKGFTTAEAIDGTKAFMNSGAGNQLIMNHMKNQAQTIAKMKTRKEATGQALGAAGASVPQQTGGIEFELREAGIEDPGLTALLGGVAGGALEAAPAVRLLRNMFPGVKKEVSTQFVKDFAVATGTQFMLEGGTEAAQEVISLASLAYHDPSFDMFSPDSKKRVIEAFAAGALVGAVTGGGSRAAGEVGTRLRKMEKPTLPTFDFERETSDFLVDSQGNAFQPADNTVFQEIKRRVDATIVPKVNGAMNAVAAKLQPVVDKMDEHLAGGVNPETATFSQLVTASNKQFWEDHKAELERLRQYKDEKIKWIYETMEQIQTEEGRQQFLERSIADVKEATQAAIDRLRRRAQAHEQKTAAEVDNMEFPDDFIEQLAQENEQERQAGEEFTDDDTESPERVVNLAEPGDVTPPPARIFGKRQRTSQAQEAANRDILEPYDNMEQAEKGRATLLRSLPGSTEEDFNLVMADDGTVTIELMNNEFTAQLKLNNSIDRALKSATGATKNNERIIKIPEEVIAAARENPDSNVGGWKVSSPNIDVVTLAHAGKDLEQGNVSLEQGYINMAGELMRLGWMDNATFEAGRQKLDKFLNKDRKVEKTPASLEDDRRRPNNFKVQPQAIEDMNSFVEQMRARGMKIPNKMFQVFENPDGTYTWGIDDKTRARALQAQDPDAFRVMLRALGDQRFQTKLAQDTEAEYYGTSVTSAAGDVNLQPAGTRGVFNPEKGRVEGRRLQRPDNPGVTGQQRMQVVGEETIQEGEPNLTPPDSGPQRDFASEPTQQGFSQRGDNIQRTVKVIEDTDPQSDDIKTNPENLESEFEDRRQELARQSNRKQAEATGPRRKGRLGPQTEQDWKRLRDWGRTVKAAFVFNPKAKKSAVQIQEPIKSAVNFIRKELGLTNNILVVDDYGLKQLISSGRMNDPVLTQTLNDPKVHARNIRIKGNSIIYLSEELMNDPAAAVLATGHELGHHVHRVMWYNLNENKKRALFEAFVEDTGVEAGELMPGDIADGMLQGNFTKFQAQFNEWMADQLAAYMGDRIRAGTQFGGNRAAPVTMFFQNVAETLQKLWNYLRNPRFKLNETYKDFVEAIRQKNAYSPDANPLHEQNLRLWFKDLGAANYAWFGEDLTQGNIDNLENAIEDTVSDARKRLIRATRRNYPAVVRRGKAIANWLSKAYTLALAPATGVMRNIAKDVPAAQQLVRIFNREGHGQAKQSSNYHQRLNLAKGQFLSQYKEVQDDIHRMLDAKHGKEPKKVRAKRVEREMKKIAKSLRSKEGKRDAQFTPIEQKVRKLFDDMHDYAVKSGLPLNKIRNYLPKTVDKEKWIRNEQKIIAYMTDKMLKSNVPLAKAQQRAREFYNSMLNPGNSDTRAVYDATETPSFRQLNERRMMDPFFDQFLEDNLDAIVSNYVNSVTKRAEFNRFMGSRAAPLPKGYSVKQAIKDGLWDPKGKMHEILREAKFQQNATDEDITTMEKYIDANLGQLGRDNISTGTRKFMAGVMAYQNMRVLLFTVFASLPDMVGPAIRSGDMRGAFKSVKDNIATIAKDGNDLAEMARAYGIISDAASDHIMTEYVDNHFMDPKMRKWNDAFFQYTGLNWYTNFTRKMALQVGIDYIGKAAHDAEFAQTSKERAKAKRKLDELGLSIDNVQGWNRKGQPSYLSVSDMDADTTKVAEALQQFVDEAIMRPNASQRPLLASDPRLMLVYHLKGYLYAVHDIILKRIKFNIDESQSPTEYLAALSPAIAMMLLTAIGLELREQVQYAFSNRKPPTDRMDGWEYTWELFQRSGLTGISQLAFDWEGADERGMSKIAGVGGPTLSQIGEILSKPHTQTIPRAIPVVSQLPAARDAVRTVL